MLDIKRIGNDLQYAGIVFSNGKDEVYIVPLPEEFEVIKKNAIITSHPDDVSFEDVIRQSDIVETEILQGNRKIIVRKSQRLLDNKITWAVFKRDGFQCRYCGTEDRPLTYDHVMLWEEGGPNTLDNGVSACKKCNKARGNTPFGQWLTEKYYLDRVSDAHHLENINTLNMLVSGRIQKVVTKRSR